MKKVLYIILSCVTIGTSAQSLTTSLTACYELNGNAAEPVNNLTGTVSVATATVDQFNNPSAALRFNGTTSSYIQLPDDPLIKPASALSFALWVRPEVVAGGMHIVYTKNNQSSNFEAYQFEIFNGTVFRLNKANSTLNDIVLSTTTITAGQWYHITCTLDNTSLKLYVNGVLEGTTNSTFNGFDYQLGKQVFIGGTNESFNHPFLGSLDNLKFWNRVITQAEVTQLYQTNPSCSAGAPPVAAFVASSNTACAGSTVTFTDNSSNNPTSLNWQVSGPASFTSNVSTPSFTFNSAGIYTVSLTATNNSGTNTAVQNVTIHPNPIVTVTSNTNLVCIGSSAILQAAGANTYSWSTSQSGFSIQVSPVVNTNYSVQGISAAGCVSSASLSIQVKNCTDVSLQEEIKLQAVYLYPNPVGNLLTVKSSNSQSICLYNGIGSLLICRDVESQEQITIDMSGFKSGIYFLTNKNGSFKPVKIVKE
jgi:hypothetical protein